MHRDDFTRLEPIPQEGIDRATAIMRTGNLFRYTGNSPEESEVALFERDFGDYLGVRYALAVSSCTQAIELALIASGLTAGDKVLVPGFTFTAVPSAIVILGAIPVFVECTEDLRLDIDDLDRKISSETNILLLSHMRGHMSNVKDITALCHERGVTLIEDAAHALGVQWDGGWAGTFGLAGCFSFQSNKIINAGEGGMLVTNDEELFVKATYLSGAYEANYKKHFGKSDLFEKFGKRFPAHNVRMSNLTAAVARPQIELIEYKGRRFREMYAYLERELTATGRIAFPRQFPEELRVPDSIQFRLFDMDAIDLEVFVNRVRDKGVPLSLFASENNARAFYNWQYLPDGTPDLPQTRRAIENVCDMRLSSTLEEDHLVYIVEAIHSALLEVERTQVSVVNQ